jgi:hypothetical protein
MQDIESPHSLIAGEGVSNGIIPDMAHMNPSGRVGEHFQTVELWSIALVFRSECIAFFPNGLNIGFDFFKEVGMLAHGTGIPPLSGVSDIGYLNKKRCLSKENQRIAVGKSQGDLIPEKKSL